jgi:hypothetical protein
LLVDPNHAGSIKLPEAFNQERDFFDEEWALLLAVFRDRKLAHGDLFCSRNNDIEQAGNARIDVAGPAITCALSPFPFITSISYAFEGNDT